MNIIHSISTDEFDPISLGKNYLYNQYEKIISFVVKNIGSEYEHILAKPVLTDKIVNWYSDCTSRLKRLDSFSEEEKIAIKKSYWELMQTVQKKIEQLSASKNKEKKEWANLLNAVFNDNNNVIFSDGSTVVLLWGWRFNNRNENFLPANFINEKSTETSSENGIQDEAEPISQPVPIFVENSDEILINEENTNKSKLNWWQKLVRFLRYFMYRYWKWLMFLLLILLLICLFRKCCEERCNRCEEYDSIYENLNTLEEKLNIRCPELIEEDTIYEEEVIEDNEFHNDTVIDNELVQKPTENCRTHFSGLLMSDYSQAEYSTTIWKLDKYSEYVGEGEYPRAKIAFPKSHKATFDGIAIDNGTRVIIYSKQNFQGEILMDEIGPAIITNEIRLREEQTENIVLENNNKVFKEPLNTNFPPSCRKMSKTNMFNWSNGSLKVICEN